MTNKINNIEIEIRGPLKNRAFAKKIIDRIKKENKATSQEYKQVVVFYKENDQDFRIKWDNDKQYFEFIYKTKKGEQRTVRDEFAIKIDKKQTSEFFEIIKRLGLKSGFVSPVSRIDINTPYILWSFKLGSVIGNYWEAEATPKLTRKFKGNTKKIKNYLKNKARLLNLLFWNEKEFKKVRMEKWSKIQPIPNSKIIKFLQNGKY